MPLAPGYSGSSGVNTIRKLYDTLGREMSQASSKFMGRIRYNHESITSPVRSQARYKTQTGFIDSSVIEL